MDPPTSSIDEVLSNPPFVVVEGVVNIRAVGGYATHDPQWSVKPLSIFRSGELSRISDIGKEQFRALGITKVFDFRSDQEIKSFETASPSIEGVEFIRLPIYGEEVFDPSNIIKLLKRFEVDEIGTGVGTYLEILNIAGQPFKTIFTHLRDRPDEPCLVHCTSGKDRTGVLAAVLLMLLGVSDEDITKDYALTALGLQPFIPMLTVRYQQEPLFRDNWEGFVKMGGSNIGGSTTNLTNRQETMAATLDLIREQFGGVENYLKDKVGLTDHDLAIIRRNLLHQQKRTK